MKRILMALLIVLFLTTVSNGQYILKESSTVTISLDSTDVDTLYVLFPTNIAPMYVSETLPTSTLRKGDYVKVPGNLRYIIEADTSTGMTNAETDSLFFRVKTLIYDGSDKEYKIISTDSMQVIMNQSNTYLSTTATVLDWTSNREYSSLLSGFIGPDDGLVIIISQYNATAGRALLKNWFKWTEKINTEEVR